jgi:hypothetical protein
MVEAPTPGRVTATTRKFSLESGMPGNWPVPFGKGPSEKDPRHGYLVGGLLLSERAGGEIPPGYSLVR